MQETKRLKNSDKVKALQKFLNDESNYEIDYDAESLQKGIKDFLAIERIEKSEDDLPSLIDNFVSHYQGKPKSKEIDFSKTTNSDFIDGALEPVRGMMAILTGMALSCRGEEHQYQRQAYDVLHDTCENVLNKFDEIAPQLDYMEDVIRGKIN